MVFEFCLDEGEKIWNELYLNKRTHKVLLFDIRIMLIIII